LPDYKLNKDKTVVKKLFAKTALLAEDWAKNVLITLDHQGVISDVAVNQSAPEPGAEQIKGVLIPGIANCHSHAFQRAMVGLAEKRGSGDDSFWGWRDVMYRFLATIGPEELQAIAAQLYVEMLKAGHTGVAEFHYLHHSPNGTPYDDPAQMSHRIVEAAREAGIQLTLLPVLYGKQGDQLLDAWIFATQRPAVKDVMVAGQWQVRDGRHCDEDRIRKIFFEVMSSIGDLENK
jgi:formimidoylglutamate deiminase